MKKNFFIKSRRTDLTILPATVVVGEQQHLEGQNATKFKDGELMNFTPNGEVQRAVFTDIGDPRFWPKFAYPMVDEAGRSDTSGSKKVSIIHSGRAIVGISEDLFTGTAPVPGQDMITGALVGGVYSGYQTFVPTAASAAWLMGFCRDTETRWGKTFYIIDLNIPGQLFSDFA